jgi:hypothetical protein
MVLVRQEWQVLPPGADGVRVLLADHPDGLREVAQIMSDPRREQLAERDAAEFRMCSASRQLIRCDFHLLQRSQISFTHRLALVQQLGRRFTLRLFKLREAVEWLEGSR